MIFSKVFGRLLIPASGKTGDFVGWFQGAYSIIPSCVLYTIRSSFLLSTKDENK